MESRLSLALTSALLFLILSSRYAIALVRRMLGLTEDMSLLARTAVFAMVIMWATTVV